MMNKIFTLFLVFVMSVAFVSAYTINGDLSDWGVTKNDIKVGLCELNNATNTCDNNLTKAIKAWKPHKSKVDYIVENNRDDQEGFTIDVLTWYNATGVHVLNGVDYFEPSVFHDGLDRLEPIFGERFDLEALYFDNDEYNAYFAIVTSMPPGISVTEDDDEYWMGDLQILVDAVEGVKEYGIVLNDHAGYPSGDTGLVKGDICEQPDMADASVIAANDPAYIESCDINTGSAEIVYKKLDIEPEGYSGQIKFTLEDDPVYEGLQDTYVIELRIPLEYIGNPNPAQGNVVIHSTLSCGNDVIDIQQEDGFDFGLEIPEMGTIAAGTALAVGAFGFLRVRRKRLGGK